MNQCTLKKQDKDINSVVTIADTNDQRVIVDKGLEPDCGESMCIIGEEDNKILCNAANGGDIENLLKPLKA